jgi:type II secretory ATPase GspE/PulE/Tfp pilus assembly ATPase PilB-like protein
VVTQDQIDTALEKQKSSHSRLLANCLSNWGSDRQPDCRGLAEAYGVPYAQITPRLCDPEVVDSLPHDFSKNTRYCRCSKVLDTLTLPAANRPTCLSSTRFGVLDRLPRPGCLRHRTETSALTLQTSCPPPQRLVIDEIIDEPAALKIFDDRKSSRRHYRSEDVADSGTVVKLVNYIIYSAVHENASTSTSTGRKNLRVRYRRWPSVQKMRPPYQMHAAICFAHQNMADLDIAHGVCRRTAVFTSLFRPGPSIYACRLLPGTYGEKDVIRVIDFRKMLTNLESLGFS